MEKSKEMEEQKELEKTEVKEVSISLQIVAAIVFGAFIGLLGVAAYEISMWLGIAYTVALAVACVCVLAKDHGKKELTFDIDPNWGVIPVEEEEDAEEASDESETSETKEEESKDGE